MTKITAAYLDELIAIESSVHYGEPPPLSQLPFIAILRDSPILISAPHGARTFRNLPGEKWHEEDEYTAGMSLLVAELCGTSVITTIWRTDDSDPNYHGEPSSQYKRTIRKICASNNVQWVIDLHGASHDTDKLPANHLVDLGYRKDLQSIPKTQLSKLEKYLVTRLGKDTVHHNAFPAIKIGRTVTAFCHEELKLHCVQIEMKPSIRIPRRRTDATRYSVDGPFVAPANKVIGMIQGLVDFINYLVRLEAHNLPKSEEGKL